MWISETTFMANLKSAGAQVNAEASMELGAAGKNECKLSPVEDKALYRDYELR
jgi:hypothetical protein